MNNNNTCIFSILNLLKTIPLLSYNYNAKEMYSYYWSTLYIVQPE